MNPQPNLKAITFTVLFNPFMFFASIYTPEIDIILNLGFIFTLLYKKIILLHIPLNHALSNDFVLYVVL
jgi:hypothetical protein